MKIVGLRSGFVEIKPTNFKIIKYEKYLRRKQLRERKNRNPNSEDAIFNSFLEDLKVEGYTSIDEDPWILERLEQMGIDWNILATFHIESIQDYYL